MIPLIHLGPSPGKASPSLLSSRAIGALAVLFLASACGREQVRVPPSPLVSVPAGARAGADHSRPTYPAAAQGNVVDDYHGTKVADPYRWMEDADAPATRAWITAENRLSNDLLSKLPGRSQILKRLTKLYNFEKYTLPFKEGGRCFWTHNDGLQNQDVLFWGRTMKDPGTILLDPNALSADGTTSLGSLSVSHDGKYLAYALSRAGSDWQEWYVRDIDSGRDTSDHLNWAHSEASFSKDNKGFYYSRFPEPSAGRALTEAHYDHKLYYHRLGEPQAADQLVYERPDARKSLLYGTVTQDGSFLIIAVTQSQNQNALYYQDLRKKRAPILPIAPVADAHYAAIANEGSTLIVLTDQDAPNGKAVLVDLRHPEPASWKPFMAESRDKLDDIGRVGNQFFFTYVHDAHSRIITRDGFDPNAPAHELAMPGIGSAAGFAGRPEDRETFWSYSSFTEPGIIYHYDLATKKSTELRRVHTDFNPDLYETKQVFFTSKDKTSVPMFLVYKKGLVLDGHNPTVLYGYGGFGWSQTPEYRYALSMWMDMGGVYAAVNARGGGEYGERWHLGGAKTNKQNVFDDFIAAAEWLVAHAYTVPSRLAVHGGSNGGLMVGAVETQRPELFGACVADAGVMDMLRYHKFTSGHMWADEFGTSDDAALFAAIYRYSPLHHVKAGVKYPPTLLTTADHDDRVVPAHSFKFAAALQAAQAGDAPILLRVETNAGHGAGKPTSKALEEAADRWAFFAKTLRVEPANLPR